MTTAAGTPRIAIVSTSDVVGGAAQAAFRLHRAMRAAGMAADFVVRDRAAAGSGAVVYRAARGLRGWRERRRAAGIAAQDAAIARRPPGYEPFSAPDAASGMGLARLLAGYDIVNLHWVAGFADVAAIRAVAADAPVVWTLHDMNPFTGGCHYDDRCGRYRIGCGACPQLGSDQPADLSTRFWARKRDAFAAIAPGRLVFVAPSRWMADTARESPLIAGRPVHTIANGVDLDRFHDRRSATDRERFGIAPGARVVLFASQYLSNRRKGLGRLLAAMGRLAPHRDTILLALGREPPAHVEEARMIHVPFTHDDAVVASAYRAADVVAVPSIQDNLPNAAVEALASGTPVVASGVGGLREIVDDGTTGILARTDDADEFAAALARLLDDDALRATMGLNARQAAMQRFAFDRCARAYRDLFATLV